MSDIIVLSRLVDTQKQAAAALDRIADSLEKLELHLRPKIAVADGGLQAELSVFRAQSKSRSLDSDPREPWEITRDYCG